MEVKIFTHSDSKSLENMIAEFLKDTYRELLRDDGSCYGYKYKKIDSIHYAGSEDSYSCMIFYHFS
jgi:hypothetical protein